MYFVSFQSPKSELKAYFGSTYIYKINVLNKDVYYKKKRLDSHYDFSRFKILFYYFNKVWQYVSSVLF